MIRVAYLCEPQLGGTFSYFQHLAGALIAYGVEIRCVSTVDVGLYEGTRYAGYEGVDFLKIPKCPLHATQIVIDKLTEDKYDLVMVLAGGDEFCTNLTRYLPSHIRCVMRVPMMTRGAYHPVRVFKNYINQVIAISDRIHDDLVRYFHISEDKVETIYHGVDTDYYCPDKSRKDLHNGLRIIYSGRLVDEDKGVLYLPEIAKSLKKKGIGFQLYIAGTGPDYESMNSLFNRYGVSGQVVWLGHLSREEVREYYQHSHVIILPSRFEGCGLSLLEGMACGCVPVVSQIHGSLDVIIEDGITGMLARVGDHEAFSAKIARLFDDRNELKRISDNARNKAVAKYSVNRMAMDYFEVFERVLREKDNRDSPLPITSYSIPRALKPGWRRFVPKSIKKNMRVVLERMGLYA